jgi:hypothetical protein
MRALPETYTRKELEEILQFSIRAANERRLGLDKCRAHGVKRARYWAHKVRALFKMAD